MGERTFSMTTPEPTKLTITIVGEEDKKTSKAHLIYETITLDKNDPILEPLIKELLDEFTEDVDYVKINATMIIT
jgi:hypothetical protein